MSEIKGENQGSFVTEDKLLEVAERYGMKTVKVENKEEAGFYIGGKQQSVDELFDKLFVQPMGLEEQLPDEGEIEIEGD